MLCFFFRFTNMYIGAMQPTETIILYISHRNMCVGLTEFHKRARHVRFKTSGLWGFAAVWIKIGTSYGFRVTGRPSSRVDHVHELCVGAVQTVRSQRYVLESWTSRIQTCAARKRDGNSYLKRRFNTHTDTLYYVWAGSRTCDPANLSQTERCAARPGNVSAETVTDYVYVGRIDHSELYKIFQQLCNYLSHFDGQIGWHRIHYVTRHASPVRGDHVVTPDVHVRCTFQQKTNVSCSIIVLV